MEQKLIFIPLLAQAMLTVVVWFVMYKTRISEIKQRKLDPQLLARSANAITKLDKVGAADNFRNLFETPVLFYVAIITLYVTGLANTLYFWLATVFVILRCLHSFIHITYNKVMHRFIMYFLSSIVLWVMWLFIAFDIFS